MNIIPCCSGLGFAYELRLARDGKHGGPGENNTWTGMIGELVRGVSTVIFRSPTQSLQLWQQKNDISWLISNTDLKYSMYPENASYQDVNGRIIEIR